MGKYSEAIQKSAHCPAPDVADKRPAEAEGKQPPNEPRSQPVRSQPAAAKTGPMRAKSHPASAVTRPSVPVADSQSAEMAKPGRGQVKSAAVPMVPGTDQLAPELITVKKPQSFEAEQFKLLRTRLLFPSQESHPPRTIMVTSALPGEGKSFVSANLAVSIAQGIKEHVLLIDCDLRRPTTHRFFGYSGYVPGLSRYLSDGATSLEDVLVKTSIEKLTLLPAGIPVFNPAELLSSPRMTDLIGEVRTRYDDRYIILDTPPPKMIAEANALARQVDAILLVVRYGRTPRAVLKDLVETLSKEKIIGTVINRFDIPMGSLYSNYYNYREHKKYYQ